MTYLQKVTKLAAPAFAMALALLATPQQAAADSNPFVGEIAPMGIMGFCPRGWAETNGQLLAINSNNALFSLLGVTFGGDGRTTFGLPDLRGRRPINIGTGPGLQNRAWGQKSGAEQTIVTTSQMASHTHAVNATNEDGDKPGPGGKLLGAARMTGVGQETIYSDQGATVTMNSTMISSTGSNLPVSVTDPALVIRYCIALQGIYPSRS